MLRAKDKQADGGSAFWVAWSIVLDPATKDVISDLYPRHGRRKKTEVDIFASEKGPSGYHYQLVDSESQAIETNLEVVVVADGFGEW